MTGRPRILYLLTDEISSVLVRGQLGYLVEQGFDVTVATRLADDGRPAPAGWDDGVEVRHLPFVREPSPIADLVALRATVRLIRSVRPDVVNSSTPKAGLLGTLAARWCRVPVRVYVVRGLRFETMRGSRRRFFARLERLTMRRATHVVFNSASLRRRAVEERLLRHHEGEVIGAGSGNGVDPSRFDPERLPSRAEARDRLGVPESAATVVGFVGRFTRDKGVADLVRAVEAVRAQHPGVHVLAVGQFEAGDPVGDAVRTALADADRATVVPWLDDPSVAYRAMDVLVFPSYREGLPNVPLEAQLCGVPVVAYAATGTVDAVRDGATGVLVPVGDVDGLAASLGSLLDDDERAQRMGAAGRAWVLDTFDRRRVWRGWVERYRAWLGDAPVAAALVLGEGGLPLVADDVEVAEFDDDYVVYDGRCRQVHLFGSVLAVVFDACRDGASRQQLFGEFVDAGHSAADADAAIDEAVAELARVGVLAGSEVAAPP